MFRAAFLFWLMLLHILPVYASDSRDSLHYLVSDESWKPYWIIDDNHASGILNDFMLALNNKLTNMLEPIHPVPIRRARSMFLNNRIQVECCVNEQWRSTPQEQAVSLFSNTVMQSEEVLIFAKGQSFPFEKIEDLQGRHIATVRGYGYVGSEYFHREDGPDTVSLILRVARNQPGAGIVDSRVLQYLLHSHQVIRSFANQIEIGPVINHSALKIRIHRSAEKYLPDINAAIRQIKSEGTLDRIESGYLTPGLPQH